MELIGLEVFLIFLLLIINGLFSMSEIALVSARKARLEKSAEDGNMGAKAALEIANSPDRFLSTVQIGITLVGILSGAFGGATLARHLVPFINQIDYLAPFADSISFVLVVIIITYFSLVIGELVPKRLALNSPEKIAARISRPMNLISKLTAPIVWLLSTSTRTLLKILRQNMVDSSAVTEEEIKAMIMQGKTDGVLEETEQELMESVIRLDDQNITALMTPRTKIGWINQQESPAQIRRQIKNCRFSRLLVGDGEMDNIRGFVKAKDILNLLLEDMPFKLEPILKQPLFIPETTTALEVLEQFRDSDTHLAVIIDEFGSTHGIITTNDILKAIVGDLPVGGILNESAVQREDGSWLLDARLSNIDFCDILQIKNLPADESGMYETLAGFIIKRLEKLPVVGDKFEWENHSFEVVDMDGKRVDRVLVMKADSE
jgi:putative hemolysin